MEIDFGDVDRPQVVVQASVSPSMLARFYDPRRRADNQRRTQKTAFLIHLSCWTSCVISPHWILPAGNGRRSFQRQRRKMQRRQKITQRLLDEKKYRASRWKQHLYQRQPPNVTKPPSRKCQTNAATRRALGELVVNYAVVSRPDGRSTRRFRIIELVLWRCRLRSSARRRSGWLPLSKLVV